MLNGPRAYRALDEALKDLRREEDAIGRRLARAAERVARFRQSEIALVRDLARLRLAPEAEAGVSGKLGAAEDKARGLLAAHAAELGRRESALDALEKRLGALSADRATTLEQMEALRDRLEGFEETARKSLAADPAHAERTARLEALGAMIARAGEKAAQARADAVEKSRPYDADPLFSYLFAQGYGTPAYRAAPLIAWGDGKVAALVRFADARANYLMLKSLPERLSSHLERLEAERETLESEVASAHAAAIVTTGGGEVLDAVADAEARLAALDADEVAAEDERDRLTEDHGALLAGRESHFDSALAVLEGALRETDSATLLDAARSTPAAEDDALVEKLKEARLGLSEVEAEIRDQKSRLATLETRRRELEDIAFEFRTERFDDPRARFGEDRLTGDLLDDFLRGAISASSYWTQWRRSQDWAGTSGPILPDRAGSEGGFRLPPGGFSPRPPGGWGRPSRRGPQDSGGFSRPRSGARGGRTSGGFKTGGGF